LLLYRQPERGEELQVDSPLVLTFDQGMDRLSVEDAFTIEPEVKGTLEWADERILVFTPDKPWARQAVYRVQVAASAKNQVGIPMYQEVAFRFTTTGYLEVTQVQPAPDTEEVEMDGTVTIMFNRPVVPLVSVASLADLPDPLVLNPAVAGTGEWINTSIYVFSPDDGFAPSTIYEATVPAGLTDTTGGILQEDYTWSFTTQRPRVLKVSPLDSFQYVVPTQTVSVTFNQPMDTASVEAGFSLAGRNLTVDGTFHWSDDNRQFEFVPDAELPRNTTFTAKLQQGTLSAGGHTGLEDAFLWSFKTVDNPRVNKITPTDGTTDVRPYSGVYIYFTAPMDQETMHGNLAIDYYNPYTGESGAVDVTNVYSHWQKLDTELYVGARLLASTQYTVTVSDGFVDKYGVSIPEGASSRFSTAQLAPQCYIGLPGRVGTFNAYTTTTTIVGYRNVSQVDFSLYKITSGDLVRWSSEWQNWGDRETENLSFLHSWSVSVLPDLNTTEVKRFRITDAAGEGLAPGLYYLQVRAPEVSYTNSNPAGYVMVVSRSNVVLKRTLDEVMVWVTDLQSGQPVNDAQVTLLTDTDYALSTGGRTDGDGISRAQFKQIDMWNTLFAVVEQGDDIAVGSSQWTEGISSWEFGINSDYYAEGAEAIFYTDRPIYRPGQTVYYKGILRLDDDAHYFIPPPGSEVEILIQDSQGRELSKETMPLSEMGTVNGEIALDEEAALGFYVIEAILKDADGAHIRTFVEQFRVAEYKKPEYQVEVQTDMDQYVHGDQIQVAAQATYYFGGPVANAKVRWAVLSQDYYYQWSGPGWYNWYEWEWQGYGYYEDQYPGYGSLIAEGTGETGADGTFVFDVPADIAEKTQSQVYTLEVTVIDVNNQEVSNRTQTVVHKGTFYVGLSPRRYVGQAGKETVVDLKAVDIEGKVVPGQEVEVVFSKRKWYNTQKQGADGRWYWDWEVQETPAYTATVTTDKNGDAAPAFTPQEGGSYVAHAIATDERGNQIRSATYFWVSSSEWITWRRDNNDRIELIADKREYEVGDVAEILVPSPFQGPIKALLTVERGEVLEYRVIDIETNSDIIKIPIVEDYVPNVFVSIVLVKGMDESNPLAAFKLGYIALPVSTESKTLNVTLIPDRDMESDEHYRPRETASYEVLVTDHTGQGVETELSLDLVDLSVLALTGGERGTTLLDQFYYQRGVGIQTAASLVISADRVAAELPVEDEGKGGGGGEMAGEGLLRTEFVDTAYWNPVVQTDASGRAKVEIKLPDNLTTWRMRGRGVTADTLVGEGTVDVLSTLDVLVRTVAPRFFVVGDQATLSVVAHNNTSQDLQAQISLEAEGLELSGGTKTVTVPAKGKTKVDWQVEVQYVEEVVLRAGVKAGPYADAMETRLPVYKYSSPEVVATTGQLPTEGERLEAVILPQRMDATQGELTIQVDPSLAAGMRDGLDYLEHYPYECIEQTVSRWLPNVLTYKALKDLGIENDELEEKLPPLVSEGLQRIYSEQKYDGGWGWWSYSSSNPFLSAYVLLGLVHAEDAGFVVDEDVVDSAISYLSKQLSSPSTLKHTYQFNTQAFLLYVLAEADAGQLQRTIRLYDSRKDLSHYGKAYLAMALGLLGDSADNTFDKDGKADTSEQVQTLLSDLSSAAILSASGAHWEEETNDYWSMNTNIRSTAIIVDALSRLNPEHALLPNAVRWLMVARQGGRWETTQETAWALMALTDYMVVTGELDADYSYKIALNGRMVQEQTITKQDVDETYTLEIPIFELLEQEISRVWVVRETPSPDQTGQGQLYYAMYLRYYLPVEDVTAKSRGIMVARQYEPVDCTDEDNCPPIDGTSVGEVFRVKITLVAPTDLHYLVVEDPLPAGCEAVDRSLKTTTVVSEDPSLNAPDKYGWGGYGWGWWWFTHSEVRDEKVALFADYLPSGTYEYTYLVRASVPGEFLTIPTVAYEMYFPEVWGRSDGGTFVVSE